VGASYLLTSDARNILRASYSRVMEIVNGRDSLSGVVTSPGVVIRDLYDVNGDGVFELENVTLPVTRQLADLEFSKDLHQPYIDEFVAGYRRQFPGQVSLDVSGTRRYIRDTPALLEINGFWPEAAGQPFGGFGRVDPNRGTFYQQVNNTWSHYVVTSLDVVVAKNLSHGFQLMSSFSRQWQHVEGTWNPADPARFIQPGAFANNREIPRTAGNNEQNTLDGGGSPATASWRPFTLRIAGQYLMPAPLSFSLAGSLIVSAGDFSGPLLLRLAASDPAVTMYGPAQVRLADGRTTPNPLATTIRFANSTRGDGQIRNDTMKALQLKVGRRFRLGRQEIETSLNIFNVLNSAYFQQYASGANRQYAPADYLRKFNRQPPRAFQITIVDRF
jgi:hypothetical protein